MPVFEIVCRDWVGRLRLVMFDGGTIAGLRWVGYVMLSLGVVSWPEKLMG